MGLWEQGVQDAPCCHCGLATKVLILNGYSFKGFTCKADACGGQPSLPLGLQHMWNDSYAVLLHGFSFCILEYSWINVVISITRVRERSATAGNQLEGNSQWIECIKAFSYFLKLSVYE